MDELNKRIIELMIRLALNKSSFAKELDVSLPLITHITSGRNKPGLDIIQKILSTFKQISPDWLLLGKGEMYKVEPKATDFTDIYLRIKKVENALKDVQSVNETIQKYHKILIDEINHLGEMSEMIDGATTKLQHISPELQKIREQLESKP